MTTTTQLSNAPLTQPHVAAVRGLAVSCRCGQDLDVCSGNHCPRCGTTLHHQGVLALAA
jgi:hypothetical protein